MTAGACTSRWSTPGTAKHRRACCFCKGAQLVVPNGPTSPPTFHPRYLTTHAACLGAATWRTCVPLLALCTLSCTQAVVKHALRPAPAPIPLALPRGHSRTSTSAVTACVCAALATGRSTTQSPPPPCPAPATSAHWRSRRGSADSTQPSRQLWGGLFSRRSRAARCRARLPPRFAHSLTASCLDPRSQTTSRLPCQAAARCLPHPPLPQPAPSPPPLVPASTRSQTVMPRFTTTNLPVAGSARCHALGMAYVWGSA